MVVDFKIVDNVGNTVYLHVLLAEPTSTRDIQVHLRPSDKKKGEKDALMLDVMKVSRIWVLTCIEDNAERFYNQIIEKLTKTMQQNPPIKFYMGTKVAGGYVYDGVHGAVGSVQMDMEFTKGGDNRIVFKVLFQQGAVKTWG